MGRESEETGKTFKQDVGLTPVTVRGAKRREDGREDGRKEKGRS